MCNKIKLDRTEYMQMCCKEKQRKMLRGIKRATTTILCVHRNVSEKEKIVEEDLYRLLIY